MPSYTQIIPFWMLLITFFASPSRSEQLVLDPGKHIIKKAFAKEVTSGNEVEGAIIEKAVIFDLLKPGKHYDLILNTTEDKIIHLLDTAWYIPSKSATGKLDEEDKSAISTIVTEIKSFTNHNSILSINGNADRAVAVMELYRDSDFHARQGDEIIWRIEVWYFENQAGGWAKVQQQNRVIERVRFTSKEEFEKRRANTIFINREEGIALEKGKELKFTIP